MTASLLGPDELVRTWRCRLHPHGLQIAAPPPGVTRRIRAPQGRPLPRPGVAGVAGVAGSSPWAGVAGWPGWPGWPGCPDRSLGHRPDHCPRSASRASPGWPASRASPARRPGRASRRGGRRGGRGGGVGFEDGPAGSGAPSLPPGRSPTAGTDTVGKVGSVDGITSTSSTGGRRSESSASAYGRVMPTRRPISAKTSWAGPGSEPVAAAAVVAESPSTVPTTTARTATRGAVAKDHELAAHAGAGPQWPTGRARRGAARRRAPVDVARRRGADRRRRRPGPAARRATRGAPSG